MWEKLSLNIDEINADNLIASKVLNAELVPPASVWEKIDSTINNVVDEKPVQKKGTVINLRRLAVAAIFIGVVVTAWILIRNNDSRALARVENPTREQTSPDTNTTQEKDPNLIDSPIDRSALTRPNEQGVSSPNRVIASIPVQQQPRNNRNNLLDIYRIFIVSLAT